MTVICRFEEGRDMSLKGMIAVFLVVLTVVALGYDDIGKEIRKFFAEDEEE